MRQLILATIFVLFMAVPASAAYNQFNDDVNIVGSLTVESSASFDGAVVIDGNISSDDTVYIADDVSIVGSLSVDGPIYITSADLASETASNKDAIYAQNIVKAWCLLTGSGTLDIDSSFNVAGVSDEAGNGNYGITWITDFSDSKYACVPAGVGTGSITAIVANKTPSSVNITCYNAAAAGAAADSAQVAVIAIGDQ